MGSHLRLGIISLDQGIANLFATLWTNYIARRRSLKFFYNTDRFYFNALKQVLLGMIPNTRIYFHFQFLRDSKIIEIYPVRVFREISPSIFSLVNSIAVIFNDEITNAEIKQLIRIVYKGAGKRFIFTKKVRKPVAFVVWNTNIGTEQLIFIKRKFTKSEIFEYAFDKDILPQIESDTNLLEKLSEPFKWLLSKMFGFKFIEKYLLK